MWENAAFVLQVTAYRRGAVCVRQVDACSSAWDDKSTFVVCRRSNTVSVYVYRCIREIVRLGMRHMELRAEQVNHPVFQDVTRGMQGNSESCQQ